MSLQIETSADARLKRISAAVAWSLFGVLIWLGQVRWPIEPASPELDPSWQQGLSYALAHGIRFGPEIVFSFGPLGGPQHARYEPALFWPQIIFFEFLFKGLLAWRWIAALRRYASAPDRVVFGLALVSVALNGDVFMLASVAVIASLLLREEPVSKWELGLDCTLLFAIGYVKFTYFIFVTVVCAAFVLHSAFRSRRAGWKALALVVCAAVLAWCACLQWPWDLPSFVWRSWQLASGYSESQAKDGDIEDRTRAFQCIALVALMIGFYVVGSRTRRHAFLVAGMALFGTFVAFKASFTYHVLGAPTFFGFVMLMPVVLVLEPHTHWWRRGVLGLARAGLLVVALEGHTRGFQYPTIGSTLLPGLITVEKNALDMRGLPELRESLEVQSRTLREQYALPRMKAIVQDATVDFVGSAQGYIFQNQMNWRPRPVFQSYAATNAELSAVNGRFFESDAAPEFVIFQTATLMMRVPGSEDADVQRILLRNYRLVCRERGVLLLRRDPLRASRPPPERKVVAEFDARPDEWVSIAGLEGAQLVVYFDVRYSLYGTLRRHLYHAPVTLIDVKTKEGDMSSWRLVPGQARAGVTLRPWVPFEDDWIRLYSSGTASAISEFRLKSFNDWNSLYQPQYHVRVEALPDSLPEAGQTDWNFVFGSFATLPLEKESKAQQALYRFASGHEIVLIDGDTKLVFPLEAGARRLTGHFGLWPSSIAESDGVDFKVSLAAPSGTTREIFALTLDKTNVDARRMPFDVKFEALPGERLVIETSNPPGRTTVSDAPYLQNIRIQ